jgi:serine/threonine protein kinase
MSDIRAWKKIRSLGEGGQGQTFVVQRTDRPDECQYVLKSLKNLDRGGRFDSEITALSRLAHPNVVQIVDHGDDN